MAEKVFISYSHQDGTCAHGIARYLARHGCDVWIDSKNLALGDAWASDIEAALSSANVVVAILSSSSLRRPEVLKEINISLKRMSMEGMDKCRVFFVVIGHIHPSWFKDDDSVKAIKDYLARYQYIELSAYGEVTIDSMKSLLSAIRGKGIEEGNLVLTLDGMEEGFINQNSQPEKSFDNLGNNVYYKVYAADLAPSCIYPFALDNQWLPEIFYDSSNQYYIDFEKNGFTSTGVQEYLKGYKKRNFSFAFFHYKQVIIKLNTFLYEPYFRELIMNESDDREAFKKLLANGSIVVLLNDLQTTPFVHHYSQYSPYKDIYEAWNRLCSEVSVYCIRENWSSSSDLHSKAFLRFCSNLAMDHENNVLLAQAMRVEESKQNAFLITLKTISMQSFCQTHMNGTQAQDKVDDYSRSVFYKNYIVKDVDENGGDPVFKCLYDQGKPFHHELKRLIDIYYNSIFPNTLQCNALLPDDVAPENYYLHTLYLDVGEKEVSIEELEYAFSEFFSNCEILDEIEAIGSNIYLSKWDLTKISEVRNKEAWYEYVELLEMMNRRSNSWKVDFNEIELLLQRFLKCFDRQEDKADINDLAYSFRIMIGSKVLDMVKTTKVAKVKEYGGSYADPGRIPLKVMFTIGDLTAANKKELIFLPVVLFNGRIDSSDGNGFFANFKEFVMKQCGFIPINE